jgi:hypothetical protein
MQRLENKIFLWHGPAAKRLAVYQKRGEKERWEEVEESGLE